MFVERGMERFMRLGFRVMSHVVFSVWRHIGIIRVVYLEGQGDLVSRLISPITHVVTLLYPI